MHDLEYGLEGLCHLLHTTIPFVIGCDAAEIKVYMWNVSRHVDENVFFKYALLIYDTCGGGSGLAATVYARARPILCAARDVLLACKCSTSGCPVCIMPRSSSARLTPHKPSTLALLQLLLNPER